MCYLKGLNFNMLSDTKQIMRIFWNSNLRTIFKILFFPFLSFGIGFGEIVIIFIVYFLKGLEKIFFKDSENV